MQPAASKPEEQQGPCRRSRQPHHTVQAPFLLAIAGTSAEGFHLQTTLFCVERESPSTPPGPEHPKSNRNPDLIRIQTKWQPLEKQTGRHQDGAHSSTVQSPWRQQGERGHSARTGPWRRKTPFEQGGPDSKTQTHPKRLDQNGRQQPPTDRRLYCTSAWPLHPRHKQDGPIH